MFTSSEAVMSAACCWLIILVVHTRYSTGESLKTYIDKRQAFLEAENRLQTGGALKLDPKEARVNEILMTAKREEFSSAFQGQPFLPSLHFFEARDQLETSQVFQIIRMMPKGGALHIHDFSIASIDWVIRNVTYMDDLYYCNSTGTVRRPRFKFSNDPPRGISSECTKPWQSVAKAREMRGQKAFDLWLYSKLSMWTDEDPSSVYPNSDAAWRKFESCLQSVADLIRNVEVFETYLHQALGEFQLDNVQYLEIRGLLPALQDSSGNVFTRNYTMELYSKVFRQYLADNPRDSSGAKFILSSIRRRDNKSIRADISLATSLLAAYPDSFAGYDLVGQEDLGHPLIEFLQDLLLPSQTNGSLKYFFHAGETDWQGTSVDENLIDALLLNTSRIGHGYAITKHPVVMEIIKAKQVAVEVNPISNQVLGLVSDLRNHPASILLSQAFPVVISSDDPAPWGAAPLSHDFYMAFMGLGGERADLATLKQLAQDSIRFSAMSESEKTKAMELWTTKWEEFLDKVLASLNYAETTNLHRP